jgi:polyisoprenyl-teichoic acid--peptidoglycan teichoic acid transferase
VVTAGEEHDRRGSHATAFGQGFSWVLMWTILGALIPGTGLIVAGRRRIGAAMLILIGLAGLALAGLVLFGNELDQGIAVVVDPQKLLILAAAIVAVALAWVAVVVLTNTELRQYATLTAFQTAFSWLVVVSLVVGIGLPAYLLTHYVLIARSVLTSESVFNDDPSKAGSARPSQVAADPWANTPQVNVLLIGSDAAIGREGVRPDTLILASINTRTGNTVLFSIPRSLQRAPFPEGTDGHRAWPDGYYCPEAGPGAECLINAVWTWAEGSQYYKTSKHPGLEATEDAVQGVTGLKVDTYVMLNLNGFQAFVDAIGGVTVDVHKRLPIGGQGTSPNEPYYRRPTGGWIEVGKNQHLDGYRALWFARSRWAYDDYDRVKRQRCIIGDVADQADPAKIARSFPAIAKALKKNLATGIRTEDLPAWVDLAQRIKNAKVNSLVFDPDVISTVNPDFPRIHKLVAAAVRETARTEPEVTATATPSPSATSTKKPTKKSKPKKSANPAKAQDLDSVC